MSDKGLTNSLSGEKNKDVSKEFLVLKDKTFLRFL